MLFESRADHIWEVVGILKNDGISPNARWRFHMYAPCALQPAELWLFEREDGIVTGRIKVAGRVRRQNIRDPALDRNGVRTVV